jgi:hypothetical protein
MQAVIGPNGGLQVIYLAPEGHMEAKPSHIDAGNKKISSEITYFSRYIIE